MRAGLLNALKTPLNYIRSEMDFRDERLTRFSSYGINTIFRDFESAVSVNLVDYYLGDVIGAYSEEARSILAEYDLRREVGLNSDPNPPIFFALLILYGDQIAARAVDHKEILDLLSKASQIIQGLNSQDTSQFTSKKIRSWINSMLDSGGKEDLPFEEKRRQLLLAGMDANLLSRLYGELEAYCESANPVAFAEAAHPRQRTAWAVAIGVQDISMLVRLTQGCESILLIQSNERLAERAEEVWLAHAAAELFLCREIVAPEEEEVIWYCYNDPRLDGLRAPELLVDRYPNLTLAGQATRRTRNLEYLLEEWWRSKGLFPGEGSLLLQVDDPGPLLLSAKPLFQRFEKLFLWREEAGVPHPGPISVDLAHALEAAYFRRDRDEPICWLKDERMLLRGELAASRTRVSELKAELEAKAGEIRSLTHERGGWTAEVDRMHTSFAQLRSQYEELQAWRTAQEVERSSLQAQCDRLLAEQQRLEQANLQLESLGQGWKMEQEELLLQRDGHVSMLQTREQEQQEILQRFQELEDQREKLQQQVAGIQHCHNIAVRQRNELAGERQLLMNDVKSLNTTLQQLRQELDDVRQAHDTATLEQRQIEAQRIDLQSQLAELQVLSAQARDREMDLLQKLDLRNTENAGYVLEIQQLRQKEQELIQLTRESEQQLALISQLFVQISTGRSQAL
jgi:hypothetical protein